MTSPDSSPLTNPRCEQCSALLHRIFGGEGYSIMRCSRCDLSRTLPATFVTQASYDDSPALTESYSSRENTIREYAHRVLSALKPIQSHGRLLDVGCSIGVLVEEATKQGYDAEGIDLDFNAIDYGRRRGRRISCTPLSTLNGQPTDIIVLNHVLEHIEEREPFLRDVRSHLKEGGVLAVVVPCHRGLHPRVFGRIWYGWQINQHFFHYGAQSLINLLKHNGFETIRCWQDSMDYRWRIKRRRRGVPVGLAEYLVATVGGWIGSGDQLTVIARNQGSVE